MKLVVVESPFADDIDANAAYARACMRDCLAVKRRSRVTSLHATGHPV